MKRCLLFLGVATVVAASSCPARNARAQEGQLTRAPKLTRFVPAVYPQDKHDAGVTAHVLLSIEIDEAGKVGAVEVTGSGGPDFDAAAVAAARQF
jgi:outer membrane biosynthesis protein TonB